MSTQEITGEYLSFARAVTVHTLLILSPSTRFPVSLLFLLVGEINKHELAVTDEYSLEV
jgi:hypothetical protein